MTKQKVYQYTSNKGTVLTTVDLEMGNPKILYQLSAEKGKILTNGTIKVHYVTINEKEIGLWTEIDSVEEPPVSIPEIDEVNYKELLDIVTGEEGN